MEMPSVDLTPVLERLDALAHQVERLAARQRAHDELIADMTPIAREAMAAAIERLDALDRDGTIDAVAGMLETVRTIARRDVLDVAPVGMLGVARAARKDEHVRKGLGIVVELLRRLGERADAEAAPPPKPLDRKEKLAGLLAPRRTRPLLPAPSSTPAPARAPVAPARAPACAAPSPSASADATWTRAKAVQLAAGHGVALTDAHWAVLDAARADFAASQVSPNIRRLTQIAGVTTKDLYALFPKAPGRTIAAIAGLPKPAGCL